MDKKILFKALRNDMVFPSLSVEEIFSEKH